MVKILPAMRILSLAETKGAKTVDVVKFLSDDDLENMPIQQAFHYLDKVAKGEKWNKETVEAIRRGLMEMHRGT